MTQYLYEIPWKSVDLFQCQNRVQDKCTDGTVILQPYIFPWKEGQHVNKEHLTQASLQYLILFLKIKFPNFIYIYIHIHNKCDNKFSHNSLPANQIKKYLHYTRNLEL